MDKSRIETALELHKGGMNCSQAVLCTYCELLGMECKNAFKLAEAFGAGMGSMEYVCGALSGALMVLGLKNSNGNTENITKGSTYKLAKQITETFKIKVGSVICSDIKGLPSGTMLKSCSDCIKIACEIVEENILETTQAK